MGPQLRLHPVPGSWACRRARCWAHQEQHTQGGLVGGAPACGTQAAPWSSEGLARAGTGTLSWGLRQGPWELSRGHRQQT